MTHFHHTYINVTTAIEDKGMSDVRTCKVYYERKDCLLTLTFLILHSIVKWLKKAPAHFQFFFCDNVWFSRWKFFFHNIHTFRNFYNYIMLKFFLTFSFCKYNMNVRIYLYKRGYWKYVSSSYKRNENWIDRQHIPSSFELTCEKVSFYT